MSTFQNFSTSYTTSSSSTQMTSQKPIYLNSFGGGLVLSHKNIKASSSAVCQYLDPKNDCQKWIVEYGDQEGVIALKSCKNSEYLRANGGRNGSHVGTGEKHWWKMSWWLPVKHPFAFQLTSMEYPGMMLNHFRGQPDENKLVHMWRFEQPWVHGFSWSFMDADLSFKWPGVSSTQSKISDAQAKDLEQREQVLAKAQKDIASQKAEQEKVEEQFKARRDELRQQQQAAAGNKSDGEDGADDCNKELEKKLDELRAKERDVAAREAAVNEEKQQNDAKSKDLKAKEKELQEREKQMGQNQSDGNDGGISKADQTTGTNDENANNNTSGNGVSEADLLRSENENLKLRLKTHELEAEIARLKKSTAQGTGAGPKAKGDGMPKRLPPQSAKEVSKTANMSKPRDKNAGRDVGDKKTDGDKDAIRFDCGHVVYPPPRKLRRKMIGMLYD